HEVGDLPEGDAIDEVAHRPAGDQPEPADQLALIVARRLDHEVDGDEGGDADEGQKDAGAADAVKEAEGRALVEREPPVPEVLDHRLGDTEAALIDRQGAGPYLGQLIGDDGDDAGDEEDLPAAVHEAPGSA